MPAASVRPRMARYEDSELRCAVRRIYGYEAYCACGWVGKTWKTVQGARLEGSFHRCVREAGKGGA